MNLCFCGIYRDKLTFHAIRKVSENEKSEKRLELERECLWVYYIGRKSCCKNFLEIILKCTEFERIGNNIKIKTEALLEFKFRKYMRVLWLLQWCGWCISSSFEQIHFVFLHFLKTSSLLLSVYQLKHFSPYYLLR